MSKYLGLVIFLGLSFYALLIDICTHLDGWRTLEPLALVLVIYVMAGLSRVIFGEDDSQDLPPTKKAPPPFKL